MAKSIDDWLAEGEALYDGAVGEYRELEAQITDLEQRLADKLAEVNRLAGVIQKPPLQPRAGGGMSNGSHVVTGTVIDPAGAHNPVAGVAPGSVPASPRTIAQALQGKGLGR